MQRGHLLSKSHNNNHSSVEHHVQSNHSQPNMTPRSILINQTGNHTQKDARVNRNQLSLDKNEMRNGFVHQQTSVEATTPSTPLTLSPSLANQRKILRSKSASSIDVLVLQWDKLKNEKLIDYLEPSENSFSSKRFLKFSFALITGSICFCLINFEEQDEEEVLKKNQKLSHLSPRDYLVVEQPRKQTPQAETSQLKSRSLSDKTIYFY